MKKQINVLTTNSFKLNDFIESLSPDFEIISNDLEVPEIQSMDQIELITKKAQEAYNILRKPLCVDDFGFYIEKYNNFPGALTKYTFKSLGYEGISKLVDDNEPAYYKSVVAYIDDKNIKIFEGVLKGKIRKSMPKEYSANSPINSIFVPDGYDMVFEDLKNDCDFISHRKIALKELKKYLLS